MSPSDAQRRAIRKYQQEKLEDVKFRVRKGEKQVIQEHAKQQGESVNAFLTRAVRETMERDNAKQTPSEEDPT